MKKNKRFANAAEIMNQTSDFLFAQNNWDDADFGNTHLKNLELFIQTGILPEEYSFCPNGKFLLNQSGEKSLDLLKVMHRFFLYRKENKTKLIRVYPFQFELEKRNDVKHLYFMVQGPEGDMPPSDYHPVVHIEYEAYKIIGMSVDGHFATDKELYQRWIQN